mmetsp:Transcript_67617/g.117649  ORF Transcript_67617/g.117649 Transcript_67617/m.117649 type:complete len:87 (-) Transcript_67617:21-281(-)
MNSDKRSGTFSGLICCADTGLGAKYGPHTMMGQRLLTAQLLSGRHTWHSGLLEDTSGWQRLSELSQYTCQLLIMEEILRAVQRQGH